MEQRVAVEKLLGLTGRCLRFRGSTTVIFLGSFNEESTPKRCRPDESISRTVKRAQRFWGYLNRGSRRSLSPKSGRMSGSQPPDHPMAEPRTTVEGRLEPLSMGRRRSMISTDREWLHRVDCGSSRFAPPRCAHALKAVVHCPKPGHPTLRLFQCCRR